MYSDNPLCLIVLSILKDTKESISLYALMKGIEKAGYSLVDNITGSRGADHSATVSSDGSGKSALSNELILFRKNFVVMNALYQIKKDLKGSGFNLYISSLSIVLVSEEHEEGLNLPALTEEDILSDEALSQYYLDWCNYDASNEGLVEELLSSFWNYFTKYDNLHNGEDKRSYALETLGLESSASWENIKQAYRTKIATSHPDKGGTSTQFIEIREAYQILSLMRRTNQ